MRRRAEYSFYGYPSSVAVAIATAEDGRTAPSFAKATEGVLRSFSEEGQAILVLANNALRLPSDEADYGRRRPKLNAKKGFFVMRGKTRGGVKFLSAINSGIIRGQVSRAELMICS
ncbi:MAG: hypothetical protein WA148_04535 [Actinomycetota bacterium]